MKPTSPRLHDVPMLPFAFLVFEQDSKRWGRTWVARSVLTGHVAEARSAAAAVKNLARTIDAAVYMAGRFGQTPQEWYEAQPMDEACHVATFCRLVSRGVRRKVLKLKSADCALEASIATAKSAA